MGGHGYRGNRIDSRSAPLTREPVRSLVPLQTDKSAIDVSECKNGDERNIRDVFVVLGRACARNKISKTSNDAQRRLTSCAVYQQARDLHPRALLLQAGRQVLEGEYVTPRLCRATPLIRVSPSLTCLLHTPAIQSPPAQISATRNQHHNPRQSEPTCVLNYLRPVLPPSGCE